MACQRRGDGIESHNMQAWREEYKRLQEAAVRSIQLDKAEQIVRLLVKALQEDRQVLVFGNGGSAANASHFATDLGKGASDKLRRRFRVVCLNDSVPLMTAISNDYAYEDVFLAADGQSRPPRQPSDGVKRQREFSQLCESF